MTAKPELYCSVKFDIGDETGAAVQQQIEDAIRDYLDSVEGREFIRKTVKDFVQREAGAYFAYYGGENTKAKAIKTKLSDIISDMFGAALDKVQPALNKLDKKKAKGK